MASSDGREQKATSKRTVLDEEATTATTSASSTDAPIQASRRRGRPKASAMTPTQPSPGGKRPGGKSALAERDFDGAAAGSQTDGHGGDGSSLDDEATFYQQLKKYVVTDEQLVDNGYPRPVPGGSEGVASVSYSPPDRREATQLDKDKIRCICRRCDSPFEVNLTCPYTTSSCRYHPGRLPKKHDSGKTATVENKYDCCSAGPESIGCKFAECHVWGGRLPGLHSGYVKTKSCPPRAHAACAAPSAEKVYAIDCEMCYTKFGLELCRLTVVDFHHKVVLDEFVKPLSPVVDYNTKYSGITAENLSRASGLKEIQGRLLSLIFADTILVGHALDNDLRALKLIHSYAVDTSLVFVNKWGSKRPLKKLAAEQLRKTIQAGDGGHNSFEDAVVAMELMKKKTKDDLPKPKKKGGKKSSRKSFRLDDDL